MQIHLVNPRRSVFGLIYKDCLFFFFDQNAPVVSQYDIRLVAVGGGPLVAVASQQGLSPPFWQTPYPNFRGLSHGHAAQVVAGSGGLSKIVVGGQSQRHPKTARMACRFFPPR